MGKQPKKGVTVPMPAWLARRTVADLHELWESQGRDWAITSPGGGRHQAAVWVGAVPKAKRATCGAKTRAGGTCQAKVVDGKDRCRLHGGLSTGPTTEAGKAAIAQSNRRRAAARRATTPQDDLHGGCP
jgi:hypothetical protein